MEDEEINVLELLIVLKKKLIWIILAGIICGGITAVFFIYFVPLEYTANTRAYILNQALEYQAMSDKDNLEKEIFDLNSSSQLAWDYEALTTGENVTRAIREKLDLDCSDKELAEKITVEVLDNTRIIQINAKDSDPERAALIANSVRDIVADQILQIMNADAVNVVYEAIPPELPSGPKTARNVVIGFLIGLILMSIIQAIRYFLDDTMKTEEDVEKYLQLDTIGTIPTFRKSKYAAQ